MKKLEKIMQDLAKEAEYIGEDGGMVANAPTAKEARKLMRKRWEFDCGKEDADEFFSEWCKEEDISVGWLHLIPKSKQKFYDDAEWLVSGKDKSDYEVWVYYG